MLRQFFSGKVSWAIWGVVAAIVAAAYFHTSLTSFSRSFIHTQQVEQAGGTGLPGADDAILW